MRENLMCQVSAHSVKCGRACRRPVWAKRVWKNTHVTYPILLQVKRSRVALVANGGRLYAVGGYDGVDNLSSVEMYDPG